MKHRILLWDNVQNAFLMFHFTMKLRWRPCSKNTPDKNIWTGAAGSLVRMPGELRNLSFVKIASGSPISNPKSSDHWVLNSSSGKDLRNANAASTMSKWWRPDLNGPLKWFVSTVPRRIADFNFELCRARLVSFHRGWHASGIAKLLK